MRTTITALFTAGALTGALISLPRSPALAADEPAKQKPGAAAKAADWTPLFDGKTLDGWRPAGYGGEGEAGVDEEGNLVLPMGAMLTGITYAGEVPKIGYEVELEARRVAGNDFFVGLTFPVGDSHASLILGGWGGGVCGISSIDGLDANHNKTKKVLGFKRNQWYKVRLRVLPGRIQAWLDDKPLIDADTAGKQVGIRPDIAPSKPFGLATYTTTAHLRNVRIRKVEDAGQ